LLASKSAKLNLKRKPRYVRARNSPPSNALSINLWLNLPLAHRKRLIWILSQMLENQMAAQLKQEQSHES